MPQEWPGPKRKKYTWVIFAFLLLFILGWQGIYFYTDWLWFREIGYTQVFTITLFAQGKAALVFGGLFFLVLYSNLWLALRLAGPQDVVWGADNLPFSFRLPSQSTLKRQVLAVSCILGILAALSGSSLGEQLLVFINRLPFNVKDPLLKRDVSFYVFEYPLLKHLYNFLLTSVILSLMGSVIIYSLRGAILWKSISRFHLLPRARRHFLGLLVLFFLVLAFGYWLNLGEIPFVKRGAVYGAGYADATTQIWVLYLLCAICLLCSFSIFLTIFRRDWRPAAMVVLFLIFVHVAGKGILPVFIQRFVVLPNEITLEKPYLEYNISFTRTAYNLESIEEREFPALENLTLSDIKKNNATIKNIRLWDYAPLLQTFGQLQEIRTYYKFLGVDNDRYLINGEYRQVMLAPRELSYAALPARTWVNEHLTYTHGYGLVMGPVNRITKEGLPEFFIKDIPPVSTTDIRITRPELYYSETESDYSFVMTRRPEFDYPVGEKNVYTRYNGKGGVPLSFWRKVLYAIRFKSFMILLSNDLTAESRIMYYRNIRERVSKLVPFAVLDPDPYLVVTPEGRLKWILDGYTTTSRFPYSEPIPKLGNYIRNSLKITVDAYDGTIDLYISDPKDPLIKVYSRTFPGLLKPMSQISPFLIGHIRYPPSFLFIQARMYQTYHMKDPQVFYNKEDLWMIPRIPAGTSEQEMKPYYTIMKLPHEEKEEYILLIPFTPSKKDNMAAWMAARCDAPHYGKLIVYVFPKQRLVYGPRQIAARINQDAYISQQMSLWNQRGSQVITGNLLAIPIEQSIIYVQPIFLASEKGQLPELKRIIVAYGNTIAMEENLEMALSRIFGGSATIKEKYPQESFSPAIKEKGMATQALNHYRRAQEFLRQGNWGAFGDELKKLEQTLLEMEKGGR